MRRSVREAALATVAFLVSVALLGCGVLFSAPKPMPTVVQRARLDAPTRCLVVFLPGMGDDEHVFVEHGFVESLRKRSLEIDTISAGATFGYYLKRTMIERLGEDVLRPAKARGYEQIWLVGVSMGGIGTLLTTMKHPDLVTGMFLLAPYLGDKEVFAEIERFGLAGWNPPAIAEDDYQREVWFWLKGVVAHPTEHPLYLGAGDKDHLSRGHQLLARSLRADHVFHTPGGHDWGPWKILWDEFLDRSELRERCQKQAVQGVADAGDASP